MSKMHQFRSAFIGNAYLLMLLFEMLLTTQTRALDDVCAVTASMQIYSNAFVSAETGDVGGYELAIRESDRNVQAPLYVYEGAATDDGIPLSGSISDGRLLLNGTWVERAVEYPSKRETVQTHSVKLEGKLSSGSFEGQVTIEGMDTPGDVRLKRVRRIWLCKS